MTMEVTRGPAPPVPPEMNGAPSRRRQIIAELNTLRCDESLLFTDDETEIRKLASMLRVIARQIGIAIITRLMDGGVRVWLKHPPKETANG